jgi:hypothetical protein
MRCFTETELRRGLAAVIADHDPCDVCGHTRDDGTPPVRQRDILDRFLEGTRGEDARGEETDGDRHTP